MDRHEETRISSIKKSKQLIRGNYRERSNPIQGKGGSDLLRGEQGGGAVHRMEDSEKNRKVPGIFHSRVWRMRRRSEKFIAGRPQGKKGTEGQ